MSSIYDWSIIASENAYVDESINWAEGQPPSSVNDSARAMMQRIKEYLLDNGGGLKHNLLSMWKTRGHHFVWQQSLFLRLIWMALLCALKHKALTEE